MLIKTTPHEEPPAWSRFFEHHFEALRQRYGRALAWSVAHQPVVLLTALSTILLTGYLYWSAPKGFFPQEDIGMITANIDTPQDMSYEGRLGIARQPGRQPPEKPGQPRGVRHAGDVVGHGGGRCESHRNIGHFVCLRF